MWIIKVRHNKPREQRQKTSEIGVSEVRLHLPASRDRFRLTVD